MWLVRSRNIWNSIFLINELLNKLIKCFKCFQEACKSSSIYYFVYNRSENTWSVTGHQVRRWGDQSYTLMYGNVVIQKILNGWHCVAVSALVWQCWHGKRQTDLCLPTIANSPQPSSDKDQISQCIYIVCIVHCVYNCSACRVYFLISSTLRQCVSREGNRVIFNVSDWSNSIAVCMSWKK